MLQEESKMSSIHEIGRIDNQNNNKSKDLANSGGPNSSSNIPADGKQQRETSMDDILY